MTQFEVYHALGDGNPQCLPGQDYVLVGSIEATDTYHAYLRSMCINSDRLTYKGDILRDVSSNQCYLVMTRGLYPVNLNWIQTKNPLTQ